GIAQAAPVADEVEAVTRLAGKGRVETSVAASEMAFEEGAKDVVIAGYDGEVDALTGTLLASAKNAPLILTNEDKLPNVVKEELERLGAENVYILGGEKAVSADVEADLKEDYTVERVAGDDREKTAVAVAEEVDGQTDHVFLAKGYDILADALAVGPVSALKDMPVFLTNTNRTTDATLDAMKDLGVKEVTIIGGEKAVTQSVVDQLEDYKVNRIEGDDREKTALA
ncbi:MAG: cell wall-binding repeat-containing protein, partial [Tissierella sp.]|uniref:cell wall-binding repeat-containing protein n=1 Tax=Tissierella sp. TaxID=41274 RepID=UPI003F9B6DFE